jgi:hypothetical protein
MPGWPDLTFCHDVCTCSRRVLLRLRGKERVIPACEAHESCGQEWAYLIERIVDAGNSAIVFVFAMITYSMWLTDSGKNTLIRVW